jgi:hypothetical protein
MNFIDMYKKIAEIDRAAPMYERVVGDEPTPPGINRLTGKPNPNGRPAPETPTGGMPPPDTNGQGQSGSMPDSGGAGPTVVPLNKRFDPRFKNGPEPYTIDIDGTVYKFAGRDKSGPGTGEVIKVPAAVIGIRGLGAVSVELGKDGMYYPAAASNEAAEEVEQPLDEIAQLRKDLGLDLLSESIMDECGDMPMPGAMAHSGQTDSVTMNISMNGSGRGGIKDLMDILKNIEDGPGDAGAEIVIGSDIEGMEHPFDEVYANEPDTEVQPIDAAMPTGNDLSSKGQEAPKVNGGGNPMTMESLKSQLDRLYQEIKEETTTEAAKWRDAKHKDKLYTQEPRDYDQYDYHDTDDYNGPKPDDYPGEKNLKGGGEYDHNDPLRKGYGRGGHGSVNTHGKRKGLPSRDHVGSLKGSIKSAHGTHPRPNLPK